MSSQGIDALRKPRQYRETRAHIFPSDGSLEWYLRRHRPALMRSGALLKIGGQLFVHEGRFDDFLLRVDQPAELGAVASTPALP